MSFIYVRLPPVGTGHQYFFVKKSEHHKYESYSVTDGIDFPRILHISQSTVYNIHKYKNFERVRKNIIIHNNEE